MPRVRKWRIHYKDGSVVEGKGKGDWRKAPDEGVQVVVTFPGPGAPHLSRHGVADRELITGEDTYNLNGWGEKRGSLIADADYWAIWEAAKHG